MCVTGQVLLPPHEVPVLFMAGSVRGKLDSLRAILVLHRAVSRARLQKLHSEYYDACSIIHVDKSNKVEPGPLDGFFFVETFCLLSYETTKKPSREPDSTLIDL